MKTLRICFLIALAALPVACGGGGTPVTTGGLPLLVEAVVDAQVVLPAGSAWQPQDLRLRNALGETAVASDGSAAVPVWEGGPHYVQAVAPDGSIPLLAWLEPGSGEVSSRTTAQVLLYFAVGGFTVLPDRVEEAVRFVAEHDAVDDLAAAIDAALGQGAKDLRDTVADVRPALDAAVAAVRATPPARLQGLVIDPGESAPQSGVSVMGGGTGVIRIHNGYRRRAIAYVRRTGFVPAEGGAEIPVSDAARSFAIDPRNGFSSLLGLAWDFFTGNGVFQPFTSAPIATPADPADASRTTYEVGVIGPGASFGEHYASLTESQRRELFLLWLRTGAFDVALPLISNLAIPVGGDAIRAIGGDPDVVAEVFAAINDTLVNTPSLEAKVFAGDYPGFLRDLVKVFLEGPLKDRLYGALRAALARFATRAGLQGTALLADGFLVVHAFDAVGTSADTILQGTHIARSNMADVWTVKVLAPRVELTPVASRLVVGRSPSAVTLTATVSEPAPPGTPYKYRWTNTATAGFITSGGQAPAAEIVSDSEIAVYAREGTATGTDTVTVEVFYVDSEGTEVPVGADQVSVRVADTSPLLQPPVVSLRPGEQFDGFQVGFEQGLEPEGLLAYEWFCSQEHGAVLHPPLNITTPDGTAGYAASSSAATPSVETLTVRVYTVVDGLLEPLGETSAEIRIETRRSVIQGSLVVRTDPFADIAERFQTCAIVTFSPEPDATGYTLIGKGGLDPFFFGSSIRLTNWSPTLSCGGEMVDVHHFPLAGASYSDPPNSVGEIEAYYHSRFDAFTWTIEVTYDN